MVFLDGVHVTNFKVATEVADCESQGKPRCGSRKPAGAYAGVVVEPNAPGDGDCGEPSQRYYHVYPEAANFTTILIAQAKDATERGPSGVRVCSRALG